MPAPLNDDHRSTAGRAPCEPVAGGSPRWATSCAPRSAAGRQYLPAGPQVLRAFERPMAQVKVLIVGPGPVPDAGPPDRAVVRGRPARPAGAAVAGQHLPGAARRHRHRPAGARRPDRLVGPGGAAAQPGADRRTGTPGIAPRQGLGADHRGGDPGAGGPRRAAGRGAVGQGRADPAAAARTTPRSSRRRTRRRCPPTAGSSVPGRSPGPTRCWPSRAANRSTGRCDRAAAASPRVPPAQRAGCPVTDRRLAPADRRAVRRRHRHLRRALRGAGGAAGDGRRNGS